VRCPRLLVVDDDSVSREMIGSIFGEDHDVAYASSGEAALDACRQRQPDLLLLDILMPDVDGLEVCRRLQADPVTRGIPVIFITAQGTPQEETEALHSGAVDFITKPVNPVVLRARVRTHLTLKAQSDCLRTLAFTDGLTGLANRRRFDESLETEWRRSRRSRTPLALLMGDIDQFKRYNDRYGHLSGDGCLRSVAKALADNLKRVQDMAARYGGEEFACILPDTDLDGARRLAGTLLDAIRRLAIPHEGMEPGIVTLSMGLAVVIPSSEATVEDLLAMADARLYEAKERGRNRVEG